MVILKDKFSFYILFLYFFNRAYFQTSVVVVFRILSFLVFPAIIQDKEIKEDI